MDPLIIALITIGLLLAGILLGIHVGTTLAACSVLGLWWITGSFDIAFRVLGTTAYSAIMDYAFGVLPMFILMGTLATVSGANEEIYDSANIIFSRIRGGLGITTVIGNAIFAAITGVSVASAAVFSKIAIPQMRRLGYNHRFALGTVAGSSLLGMLIPPSALLILYGILTEEAIGRLFIAGILPGLFLALVLCLGIYTMVLIRPGLAGQRPQMEKLQRRDIIRMIVTPWGAVLLIALVLGGMYMGFFTPTEAGGIGAGGALILCIVKRKLTMKTLWSTLLETGYVSASIFFLLISAQMYSRMLTISGLAAKSSALILSLQVPPLMIVDLFLCTFIVLGAILDSTSIMLICIPLMLPTLKALGVDLIWFGIILVVAVEMGLLTPPFGMVVYAMKSTLMDEATIEDIFAGAFPFLLMTMIVLIFLVAFPKISTWLPSMM